MVKKTVPPKNPVGRPSQYAGMLEKAEEYIKQGYKDVGSIVPTISGLAMYLGVSRETCYAWQRDYKDFKTMMDNLMAMQEVKVIDGALGGTMNAPFAKLLMTKHGYSDRVETDHKSSDGSMTPKAPVYKIVSD